MLMILGWSGQKRISMCLMDDSKLDKSVEQHYSDVEGDDWSGFWSNKGFDETDKTVKEVLYESKDRL